MKKNILTLMMLLTLLAGMLAACAPADPAPEFEEPAAGEPADEPLPASGGTVEVGAAQAGQTITLQNGDMLVIALEGNLTTGYNWVPLPQDPALLEQVGEVEVTPISDALGAPGMIVLKFKAVAQGSTALKLEYRQPWDDETAPEQTFEVTVVVE